MKGGYVPLLPLPVPAIAAVTVMAARGRSPPRAVGQPGVGSAGTVPAAVLDVEAVGAAEGRVLVPHHVAEVPDGQSLRAAVAAVAVPRTAAAVVAVEVSGALAITEIRVHEGGHPGVSVGVEAHYHPLPGARDPAPSHAVPQRLGEGAVPDGLVGVGAVAVGLAGRAG